MTEGYIKLYRSLLDNSMHSKSDYSSLWIHLLLMANHKETTFIFNNQKQTLGAGQLITGRKKLSKLTGISESQVYKILNYLEMEHQIKQQSNSHFTTITILNWQKYQGNGTTKEQQKEQLSNSQVTAEEQLGNTYKNVKNIKNVKNKELSTIGIDVSSETSTPEPEIIKPVSKKTKVKTYPITFNRTPKIEDAKFIGITQGMIEVWEGAYPAVDFTIEVKKAIAWIYGAGAKGYKSDWYSFLNRWFRKAQDNGGTKNGKQY